MLEEEERVLYFEIDFDGNKGEIVNFCSCCTQLEVKHLIGNINEWETEMLEEMTN